MLYGIFSDIHSNIEAFETILEFLKNYKIHSYICCGDIVGYGPNPNECIEILKNLQPISVVLGNHDAASAGLKELTWFNEDAQEAILWTRNQITEQNRMFISGLPKVLSPEFTIAHGSPRDPTDEYLLTRVEMLENLSFFYTDICFVGHTHAPFIFYWDKNLKTSVLKIPEERKKIKLYTNYKYIINVGSVGQPRDGDPRTCFVIYDSDNNELEFIRIPYEFTKTQSKMYSARLPIFLIERLTWGR